MTHTETITILRRYNIWRRGNLEDLPQPDPREIGEAIDAAVEMIDRLEAAEKERDELRTKIEQMEKQEPVARVHIHQTGGNAGISWSARPINDFDSLPLLRDGDKLYLAPGAQGEEK